VDARVTTSQGAARILRAYDFSPRQARFLTLATLTAGFCLRRQYAAFAGIGDGACVHRLFARLVASRWAEPFRFAANRGYVYDLTGLARAVGHEEGHYRVGVSAALVARKVMLLDAIVGEPAVQWHVAEGDKVELLRGHFHVPEFDLPQRIYSVRRPTRHAVTRYFTERQPIGLQGDPPTIHFVYLATTERVQGFEHFLWQHAPLFRHLLRWTVVITYPPSVGDLSRYRRAFDAFAKRWLRCDALRDLDAVRWYFKKRRALDQRDWTNIAVTDAPRFQKLRRCFSNERTEMLYRRWLTEGDAAFEPLAMPAPPCGDLVMQRLDHSYDQFGQLPGEC
jgi:hypothetical protein